MGLLDALFGQVAQTIKSHSSPDTPGPAYDPNDLLSQLGGLFGQHASQNNEEFSAEVRSASEDPHGDPADQNQFGNVRPASEDPHGDPADQSAFGNVRPASEDPYGDPADQR